MKRIRFAVVLVFLILLVLQSYTAYASGDRIIGPWSRIYEGIDYAEGEDSNPRYMKTYALRVDLWNPYVQLYASHDNGGASKEVTTEKCGTFINDHGCAVAVNASYCDATSSTTNPTNVDIWGLGISDGTVVSPGATTRGPQYNCQMLFTAAKAASIVLSQGTPSGIHTAVTGNAYHLVNGTALGANTGPTDRTSFGLSADGRYLIMVCCYGSGATILDMSYWMLDFGAWNAINMDGGGSTCMAIWGWGNVGRSVSNERLVGVHLGARSATVKGVDACSMNSGRVDIAVRGNSCNVLVKTWTSGGGWSGWTDLGGYTYEDPCIVSRGNGYLEVFYRGWDNQLYHNWNNGEGWSGWFSLGGSIYSGPNGCAQDVNNMSVVARWTDNSTRIISYNSSTGWGAWQNLGGVTYSAPAIVSRAPGCLNAFLRGTDNQLYHAYYDSGTWSGWGSLGGDIRSGVDAVSRETYHLEVFARGANNSLVHTYWMNAPWGWVDNGGVFVGDAGATVLRGTSTMKAYVRGTDNVLYSKTWTPTGGWTGWQSEGFSF